MIKIIHGAKGSGKTKIIIDMANESAQQGNGDTVFLADTDRYIREIKYQVRFINTKENEISSQESLIVFIKGLLSANYDIKVIYIDGIVRMIGADKQIEDLELLMQKLEQISTTNFVDFTLTISRDISEIPAFIKKFI